MHLKIKLGRSKSLKNIRCVMANEHIKKKEIIEKCPVVLIPLGDLKFIEKTVLTKYEFLWDENNDALALGYGSLLNHSDNPNVEFYADYKNKLMCFRAVKDIKLEEELFINYNQGSADDPLPEEYLDYQH